MNEPILPGDYLIVPIAIGVAVLVTFVCLILRDIVRFADRHDRPEAKDDDDRSQSS